MDFSGFVRRLWLRTLFPLLCVRTEAGCSCVFGLLLDKRGAIMKSAAPVTSAHPPGQGRRRSCKIAKDVR